MNIPINHRAGIVVAAGVLAGLLAGCTAENATENAAGRSGRILGDAGSHAEQRAHSRRDRAH